MTKTLGGGKKSIRVGMRLSEDLWEGLVREARKAGMNVSAFMRRVLELRIGKNHRRTRMTILPDIEPPSSPEST